jgi:hypothetical protein
VQNDTVFNSSPAPADRAEFEFINDTEGYGQVSFLSPASFHYFPDQRTADANRYGPPGFGIRLKFDTFQTPVTVRSGYTPRFDLVGFQLDKKVMVADGTRYLDGGELDFDPSPNPGIYGSFTDSTPIFHRSTAFGRQSPGNGLNIPLTFRHPGEKIDVVYFDGHAGQLSKTEAWTDASRWYPSGSTFTPGGVATPESQAFHEVGEKLP